MNKTKESQPVVSSREPASLPTGWALMSATERTEALVSNPALKEFVQQLSPEKLFLVLHDVGLDSSLQVLPHLKAEQWQGVVDLGCWTKDRVDTKKMEAWFQVASLASHQTAKNLIQAMDEELLVSILKQIATVENKDLDKDFVPDSLEIIPSPDGEFFLLIPNSHPSIPFVVQALKLAYEEDLLKGRRLLRASQSEMLSPLEESAYQFRSSRLQDMGFFKFEEAVEIFEPIALAELRERLQEPEEALASGSPSEHALHGAMELFGTQADLFLHRALAAYPAGDKKLALEEAFGHLINRHCVATQIPLADGDAIQVGALQTYGMLNLGLEALVGDNLANGVKAFDHLWLAEIYRAGYTRLIRLQRDARALRPISAEYQLFDTPLDRLMESLASLVPASIQGVTEDGETIRQPIATTQQLDEARASVHYATTIAVTFRNRFGVALRNLETDPLPGISESDRPNLRYSTMLMTGVANLLAGKDFCLDPITPAGLEHFSATLLEGAEDGRKLRESVTLQLQSLLQAPLEEDQAAGRCFALFLQQCLTQVEESLQKLPAGKALDPKFIGDLLLTTEAN